jgi:acyl carrier protein
MIPSVFVELDRLPLTPNGKVDRKALPDPWLEAAAAPEGETPRPGLESDIAAIWREVLGVERIGRTESFFALGGHSLKATQVVSRLLRRLKVRVSLADFIREPTITALARLAEAAGAQGADDRIPRAAVAPDYALSHAQHRLWLLHHLEGGETAYNMPFAFRLRGGDLDAALLEKAFAALIARHEALRTAFVIRDGEPRQRILDNCDFRIATSFINEGADLEAEIRRIAEFEARTPFDLAKPPLLRLTVVRSSEELFIFLVMHHIVGDGWSGLLLARELMEFYASAAAQRPPTLLPLPIHYKDFSEWQNARGFEKEEHYWLAALSGAPEKIALPFDFPPGRDTGFQGDVVRARLDAGTTGHLRALAAAKRTTLSNVTLALFGLLLSKISAQEDLVIGMSIANRNHPDLERLIGFFVNMLPIRLHFKEEMEFDGLLAEVVARTAEAAGHQDYPFDLLVEKINPERVSNRQPLLNVVYAFQNFSGLSIDPAVARFDASPHQQPERTEEQLEPIDFTFGTSKFDLTLFLVEEADGLALVLEYDTALFKRQSAERMLATFAHFSSLV